MSPGVLGDPVEQGKTEWGIRTGEAEDFGKRRTLASDWFGWDPLKIQVCCPSKTSGGPTNKKKGKF